MKLLNESLIIEKKSKFIGMLYEIDSKEEVLSILEELMTCVSTENGDVDFDTEFQKNYVSLYKLSAEVIKENYGDVFSALGMNVE